MKRIALVFLCILSIFAVSCSADNPANITVNETSAEVAGATEETIRMNNCGGLAPVEQTAKKSKSINVEGGGSLGLDVYVVKGEVAAKYGEISESSKEIKLTAPAGTNMEFVLRWMEKTWAGSVTAQGKNGQANYTVSVPVSVDMVSSVDLGGCSTTSQPAIEPTNSSSSSQSSTLTCIHPDQLAEQYGWKNSRIIDKFYGGYNVYVSISSQLPPLWEANYFGLDNTFTRQIKRDDTARQMDVGTWIIYAPDECRSKWGFNQSSTPAPIISSSSEIPNDVMCIHPNDLISQKGWENLGILDKADGGYKARISAVGSLPDYWEANLLDENNKLLRQIFYFDQNRMMDIGIWVIYTPPTPSCRNQFGFKIGGK